MERVWRVLGALIAVAAAVGVAVLAVPACAAAKKGSHNRLVLTGVSSVPVAYWQGLTSDPKETNLYFIGIFQGLWKTTNQLEQTDGVAFEIPDSVAADEGYNHIGDPTWNPGEGGRILLPMECYDPDLGNTCGTGAFGVADPDTLAFRYYVKLDPTYIPKAMWAETSPQGTRVWTSSGDDLLAYRTNDIKRANRGPGGPLLEPARILKGAVPPSGVTGAVFRGDHTLLLAGSDGETDQVWAVNTDNGKRRLVIQRRICGESEGLDVIPTQGGNVHWLIAPSDSGCELSFGPTSALLHFARSRGNRRYGVEANVTGGEVPGRVDVEVHVTRGDGKPLSNAHVTFATAKGRTDGHGVVDLSAPLELPGRFKAVVRKHGRWGASGLIQAGRCSGRRSGRSPRAGLRRTDAKGDVECQ